MIFPSEDNKINNMDFYDNLNENQKKKVEEKLLIKLGDSDENLDESTLHSIRCQIASDMFRLLKG